MELHQLINLTDHFIGCVEDGDYRGYEQVMVVTEDGEVHRILSLGWDYDNGYFVLCVENDVEEP